MDIFEIVGLIAVFFLGIYLVLYFYYLKINKEGGSRGGQGTLSRSTMPALRPIPIPTRDQPSFWIKLVVAIFEVRRWQLDENWHYTLKDGDELIEIVIPKGFDFDGASIPRLFWVFLSPTGLLLIPGLVHDYGYKYDQLWKLDPNEGIVPYRSNAGKPYWDTLFRNIGEEVNNFLLINIVAWLAVSWGGSGAWDRHRKVNAQPDKPIV